MKFRDFSMMIMNEVEPNIDVSERAIKNYFHACPTALMVLSIHTHKHIHPIQEILLHGQKNNNNSKRKKNRYRTSLVDKLDWMSMNRSQYPNHNFCFFLLSWGGNEGREWMDGRFITTPSKQEKYVWCVLDSLFKWLVFQREFLQNPKKRLVKIINKI